MDRSNNGVSRAMYVVAADACLYIKTQVATGTSRTRWIYATPKHNSVLSGRQAARKSQAKQQRPNLLEILLCLRHTSDIIEGDASVGLHLEFGL